MKEIRIAWATLPLFAFLGSIAVGCEPEPGPRTDSQTNWLRACDQDAECGELSCLCGVCSRDCEGDPECDDLGGSTCVAEQERGSIAACGGQKPPAAGLCLPRCVEGSCAEGQMCVAGLCSPVPEPTVQVVIDSAARFQVLTGFGATLAYAEPDVLEHPLRTDLYRAMFVDLGLDILRLRNRYGYTGDDDLTSAGELVRAATNALGHAPLVFLNSWSPPANLKASGSLTCQGDADTCTLSRDATGHFDYQGLGEYWSASLLAYAEAGVVPDYVGIQNNPDFVPETITPGEGCRFLPTEGTVTVSVGGVEMSVDYPGFDQALTVVTDALSGQAWQPKIIAPETARPGTVADFAQHLPFSQVDAIGHHLYGTDPTNLDQGLFQGLAELGDSAGLPLFQTEMLSGGFETAVLMHYSLVLEGASAYLQNALVGPLPTSPAMQGVLIALDDQGYALQDSYFAMRHYALFSDPGWTRVGATSGQPDLLVSAWISADETALTLVLTNTGGEEVVVQLDVGARSPTSSRVTRTVFDGVERGAELGALSTEARVRVPSRSIVTVALTD